MALMQGGAAAGLALLGKLAKSRLVSELPPGPMSCESQPG
jgi:hypothetical protein